jgi:leader peptidase (prepilin peptidase) / N-methyltransferase
VTAVLAVLSGLLGLLAGLVADRLARAFPWVRRVPEPVAVPAGGPVPSPPEDDAAPSAPPGPRLPAAVLVPATGVLFAALALKYGASPLLPAWLVLAAAAAVLVPVDLRHRLLPDRVVLPATALAAVLLAVDAAATGHWEGLVRALLGGAVSFGVGLVMVLVSPAGLGFGDVKLAGLLGLLLGRLGWPVLLLGFLLGFVVQALLGVALLTLRRAGRRTELPFGPALVAGCLAAALLAGSWAFASPG